MIQLRYYQKEAQKVIRKVKKRGGKECLINIATGGGKTINMAMTAKEEPGLTIVVAHREKLLVQMKEKMLLVDPTADIGIIGFGYEEWGHKLTLVGAQTILQGNRLERLCRLPVKVVIFDECHHFIYNTWYRIFEAFPLAFKLGVTATFRLGSGADAQTVFGPVAYMKTLPELIDQEFLCDIEPIMIRTHILVEGLKTNKAGDDYTVASLQRAINREDRNDVIVQKAIEHGVANSCCIAFCASKAHAKELAACFRGRGIRAAFLTDDLREHEANKVLEDLQHRRIQVCCSVNKVEEGFDLDIVNMLLLCAPTKSQSRFLQRLGRGTRLAPGKVSCLVLDFSDDCIDHTLEQYMWEDALQLPYLRRHKTVKEAVEQKEEDALLEEKNTLSLVGDDGSVIIPKSKAGDIVEQEKKIVHKFTWDQVLEGEDAGAFVTMAGKSKLILYPTSRNKYAAGILFKAHPMAPVKEVLLEESLPLSWAQNLIEKAGRDILDGHPERVDPDAPWRKKKISAKQKHRLEVMGIPIPENCTEGQAAAILSRKFAKWA